MSDEIRLWHVTLDRPEADAVRLAECLSADELARAGRFRDPALGRRFVAGRAALRAVLGQLLDRPARAVRFTYRGAGKPELADLAATGLHFNLTHSLGTAMIAVSRGRPIGVDLERLRPEFAGEAIAERFFSVRERQTLRALSPGERVLAFFRCWTRKEAFIKAIGAGLWHPLDEFDVSLAPGEPAALLALRGDEAAARRWSLRELEAPPGFVAALAVEGPISQIIVEEAII